VRAGAAARPALGHAYEILGDVYRLQGKTEEAIQMYTMALQINPRNNTIMERIERLARSSGPSAQRVFFDNRSAAATGRGGSAMVSGAGSLPGDKRPLKTLILGVFGYGLAMFLILYLGMIEQRPAFKTCPLC
jgi:tetratricopeptide (TPR) repeat protein